MSSITEMPTGHTGRLVNRKVLLLAELPMVALEDTEVAAHLAIQVEEAVTSLARAVFINEGQLLFMGDAPLALLLSMVAADYVRPRFAEGSQLFGDGEYERGAPLVFYLSHSDFPQDDAALEPLIAAGYAAVRWSDSPDLIIDETFPDALVCIGGRRGIMFETVVRFRQLGSQKPVYVIADIRGDARQLAYREGNMGDIRAFDREFENRLSASWRQLHSASQYTRDRLIPPYPVMMQALVNELAGG